MNLVDTILRLSEIFGMQLSEADSLLVLFVFAIVWQLVDVALDDEGIHLKDNDLRWPVKPQDMEIDVYDPYEEKRKEYRDRLHTMNTVMALELIARFLQNKVTSRILYLARQNMSELHSLHDSYLFSEVLCLLLLV